MCPAETRWLDAQISSQCGAIEAFGFCVVVCFPRLLGRGGCCGCLVARGGVYVGRVPPGHLVQGRRLNGLDTLGRALRVRTTWVLHNPLTVSATGRCRRDFYATPCWFPAPTSDEGVTVGQETPTGTHGQGGVQPVGAPGQPARGGQGVVQGSWWEGTSPPSRRTRPDPRQGGPRPQ